MVLSGTLIGFICVLALLFTALTLAFLDKREKNKGNLQKSRLLSRAALGLFIGAFVGGVVMTLIAGIQPRDEKKDIATARSMARTPPGSGQMGLSPMAVLGKADEAELKRLEEKLVSDPQDIGARERLGHLYLQKHDVQNVFKMAHEVMQMGSNSAESRAHMAMVLVSMQKPEEALQQIDKALAIDPKHPESLLFKGMIQFQGMGDPKGAQASWEEYLKFAKPDDPGRQRVEMFLKMIQSKASGTN